MLDEEEEGTSSRLVVVMREVARFKPLTSTLIRTFDTRDKEKKDLSSSSLDGSSFMVWIHSPIERKGSESVRRNILSEISSDAPSFTGALIDFVLF